MKRVILLVALVAVLAATAGCNWAPVISEKLPAQRNLTVNNGAVINFSVVAGDWNSDPLTYKWTASGGSPVSGTGQNFNWTAVELGKFTITVAVSDEVWTTTHSWNVEVVVFKDNFETGSTGWTATGLWHRQINDGTIHNVAHPYYVALPMNDTSDGYIPYANSGQYCFWYGSASGIGVRGNYMGTQADDSQYSGGTSVVSHSGTLTSPVINLDNIEHPHLQFASWFEIEGYDPEDYDSMKVLISVNGGPYVGVGTLNPLMGGDTSANNIPYTTGGYDTPAYWEFRSYNLSAYVGQSIRVRFEFDTIDKFRNGFRGWFIDDVEITEGNLINPAAKALNPVRVLAPKSR